MDPLSLFIGLLSGSALGAAASRLLSNSAAEPRTDEPEAVPGINESPASSPDDKIEALDLLIGLEEDGLLGSPFEFSIAPRTAESTAQWLVSWGCAVDHLETYGHRFEQLGADPSGGMLALWYRRGSAPPAVVYFGSEGETGILAATLEDFTQQIATGQVYVGHLDTFLWPDEEEDAEWDLLEIRSRVGRHLGQPYGTAMELKDRAAGVGNFRQLVSPAG